MSSPFTVILAGGSGTRFWPASRRSVPKQLLAVAPNDTRPLITAVVERLAPLCPTDHTLVATGVHLLAGTRAALPMLPADAFLGEPEAKNTAPAIAWATVKVAQRDPRGVIAVVPSDQHIVDEEAFQRDMRRAFEQARAGHITTLGISPTHPETGYGYLERGAATEGGAWEVSRFVEKPGRKTAEQYLESGNYFWNSGIFVYRADVMLEALERHTPDLRRGVDAVAGAAAQGPEAEARAVQRFFAECTSISIDYAVMEREQGLRMVPCAAGWSDLGSWQAVWELSRKDASGNASNRATVLVDSSNNLIFDLDGAALSGEPNAIALVGVANLCVVRSRGSLLVLPRERTQDVRQVVEALRMHQPEVL